MNKINAALRTARRYADGGEIQMAAADEPVMASLDEGRYLPPPPVRTAPFGEMRPTPEWHSSPEAAYNAAHSLLNDFGRNLPVPVHDFAPRVFDALSMLQAYGLTSGAMKAAMAARTMMPGSPARGMEDLAESTIMNRPAASQLRPPRENVAPIDMRRYEFAAEQLPNKYIPRTQVPTEAPPIGLGADPWAPPFPVDRGYSQYISRAPVKKGGWW